MDDLAIETTAGMMNKQEANDILDMVNSPGWNAYMTVLSRYQQQYMNSMLAIGYGPYAELKFRHNQSVINNVLRIPAGIIEEANELVNTDSTLASALADLAMGEL